MLLFNMCIISIKILLENKILQEKSSETLCDDAQNLQRRL